MACAPSILPTALAATDSEIPTFQQVHASSNGSSSNLSMTSTDRQGAVALYGS
jgi:hypothetical protein